MCVRVGYAPPARDFHEFVSCHTVTPAPLYNSIKRKLGNFPADSSLSVTFCFAGFRTREGEGGETPPSEGRETRPRKPAFRCALRRNRKPEHAKLLEQRTPPSQTREIILSAPLCPIRFAGN